MKAQKFNYKNQEIIFKSHIIKKNSFEKKKMILFKKLFSLNKNFKT